MKGLKIEYKQKIQKTSTAEAPESESKPVVGDTGNIDGPAKRGRKPLAVSL